MLNNVIDSIFSTTSTLTAGGFIVCLLVSLALAFSSPFAVDTEIVPPRAFRSRLCFCR